MCRHLSEEHFGQMEEQMQGLGLGRCGIEGSGGAGSCGDPQASVGPGLSLRVRGKPPEGLEQRRDLN